MVFERVIKTHVLRQPADEACVKEALPVAGTCIKEIERLMNGHSHLAGAAFSLADLHLAPQLYYFAMTPEGATILKEHPHLSNWLTRMMARPAAKRTMLFGLDRTAA